MEKLKQVYTLPIVDGTSIRKEEIPLVTDGCYYFFNGQHLYLKINNVERCYFDYLCENMDYKNRIHLESWLRKKFIVHFNRLTSSKKAPSTQAPPNQLARMLEAIP